MSRSLQQILDTEKPEVVVKATGGKLRLEVEIPDGSHFGFSV